MNANQGGNAFQEHIRAALIHQARQPLFVLQNYLSAATQLGKRMEETPDRELLQKCFSEMRTAIEKISLSLTRVDAFDLSEDVVLVNTDLAEFIRETFQLANFVFRRIDIAVKWEIDPKIDGWMPLDLAKTQFALIQWLGLACQSPGCHSPHAHSYLVAAAPRDGDVIVRVISDVDQVVRLGSLVDAIGDGKRIDSGMLEG